MILKYQIGAWYLQLLIRFTIVYNKQSKQFLIIVSFKLNTFSKGNFKIWQNWHIQFLEKKLKFTEFNETCFKIIKFQIWVINADLCGCCLISFAMFVASPLLLATGGIGAALGTLGGVALATLLPGIIKSLVN